MPSVIPPVVLSVATIMVVLLILGGVIYYYTTVVSEPPVLPPYGAIYVEDVSRSNGTVVVVNRYGHSVKALLSIAVNVDAVRRDTNLTVPALLSVWVTLGPGETTINLHQVLIDTIGVAKPEYILWDESGIVIGNLLLALERGAGLIPPAPRGTPTKKEVTYTLRGIGTSWNGSRTVYATKYFDGMTLELVFHHNLSMGYMRSVCGYKEVTVVTTDRYGEKCKDDTIEVTGCRDWNCVDWDEHGACRKWVCSNTGKMNVERDTSEPPKDDYATYKCGLDNVVCLHTIPALISSSRIGLRSPALIGAMHDPTSVVNITSALDLLPASSQGLWEFILPQELQSCCVYTFKMIKFWTEFSYDNVCCVDCNYNPVCATMQICREYSQEMYSEERHACQYALGGSWLCADRSVFLSGGLTTNNSLRVWIRQSEEGVIVGMNFTAVYDYTRFYDPEISDSYLRLIPRYTLTIILPPVAGSASIPYTEELKNLYAGVSTRLVRYRAVVSTTSGYKNPSPLIKVTAPGEEFLASVRPVDYLSVGRGRAEEAKTFQFSTVLRPSVVVTVFQDFSPYITVPLCDLSFSMSCGDSVVMSVEVEVEIIPVVTIVTVATSS